MVTNNQTCPHCGHEADHAESEWEEGLHQVDCSHCKLTYYASPQYKFLGFITEKPCALCGEIEDNCDCEVTSDIYQHPEPLDDLPF